MKKILNLGLLMMLVLTITSCANEETTLESPESSAFKKIALKKNIDGSYYADYETAGKTRSTLVEDNDVNEIILTESSFSDKKRHTNKFNLNGNVLKVNFVDLVSNTESFIFIEDSKERFTNDTPNGVFLKSYRIASNDDDSYQLEFDVHEGIDVEFKKNKENNTYEVHLRQNSTATETSFTRTLQMPAEGELRLDFVNFFKKSTNLKQRTTGDDEENVEDQIKPERLPRLIIIGG